MCFSCIIISSNKHGFICIIARKIRLRIIHYSSALAIFSYIFLSFFYFIFFHSYPMVPLGYLTKTLKLMGVDNGIIILPLTGKRRSLESESALVFFTSLLIVKRFYRGVYIFLNFPAL